MMTEEDEERYVLTPKGIALISMLHSGLIQSADDPRFEGFYRLYAEDMRRFGYASEEEEDSDEDNPES